MIAVLDTNAVIGLAKGGVLVTDDAVLRREAAQLGIATLGTVQTVLLLKQQGLLAAVKPVLDLMQVRGYRIDPALYAEALRLCKENEPAPS